MHIHEVTVTYRFRAKPLHTNSTWVGGNTLSLLSTFLNIGISFRYMSSVLCLGYTVVRVYLNTVSICMPLWEELTLCALTNVRHSFSSYQSVIRPSMNELPTIWLTSKVLATFTVSPIWRNPALHQLYPILWILPSWWLSVDVELICLWRKVKGKIHTA